MKKLIFLIFFFTLTTIAFGQNFNAIKFETLFQTGDFNEIEQFLNDWEKNSSSDVALYISKIDFYYSFSLSIDSTKVIRNPEDLANIFKVKDNKGKILEYKNLREEINSELISKSIQFANYGITNFPNTIDFREKKIVILKEIFDLDNLEKEIINIIEISKSQKWINAENQEIIDIDNVILGYLNFTLEFTDVMLVLGYKNPDKRIIRIWERYNKYFPNSGKNLSIQVGKAYFKTGNYKKAFEQFSIANELLPNQQEILNLLCQTSKKLGGKYPYYVPEEYCND